MNLKNRMISAVALIGLAALAGCGGGGTATQQAQTQTQTVSGVVADGYLKGATVCLDKNGNKKCDADEPTGTSGDGGKYDILNVSADDLAKYPIVVEVPVGAVDSERGTVAAGYVLSAPAGKPEFVSPLTTLVQNQIETNGLSVTEAVATVKTQLGLATLSPLDDYKPGITGASPEATMAAGVAKVIATTIADNKKAIEAAVAGSATPISVQQVVNLVVQQVMQNLATVVQQVRTATEDGKISLSEDSVKTAITGSGMTISTSDATELKQQLTAAATTNVSSDLISAATDGMYWVEQWQYGWDQAASKPLYSYGYGKVLFNSSTNTISFSEYDLVNSAWQADTNNGDIYLTSTGWKQETVTNSGKFDPASGVYSTPGGFEKEQVRAVKMDVSGQPIAPYLKGSFQSSPTLSAIFPAGSLAYKLTFVPVEDIYRLSNNTDNICKTWNNSTNSCSAGYTSLDELLASAADTTTGGNGIGFDGGMVKFGILDAVTKKGQVRITLNSNGTTAAPSYVSTYERRTVNGVDLVIIDLTSLDGRFGLLAVYNGRVVGGQFQPANVARMDSSLNFNKAAADAIMKAASLPTSLGKVAARK